MNREEIVKKIGRVCGFVNENGSVCLKLAGEGTSHFGEGYCSLHDGVRNSDENKIEVVRIPKTREYYIQQHLDKFLTQEEWDSLKRELATARAILETLVSNVVDERTIVAIIKTIDTIKDVVDSQVQLESKKHITIEEFKRIMEKLIEIIEDEVEDYNIKKKIFGRLMTLDITGNQKNSKNEVINKV